MGCAHKFGDNVDTDIIVPGQYLSLNTPAELAGVCMEGICKDYARKIQPQDVFVAGTNFGCGSSREHAPISIKGAGVTCVIAKSFARIFYRNAINIGLPVLESPEAVEKITAGDVVSVDFSAGIINNETKKESYSFSPFPASILAVIDAGGLAPFMRTAKNKEEKK